MRCCRIPVIAAMLFLSCLTIHSADRSGILLMPDYGFGGGAFGVGMKNTWTPVTVNIVYAPTDMSKTIDGELVVTPGMPRSDETEYARPLRMGRGRKRLSFSILPSDEHLSKDGAFILRVAVRSRGRTLTEQAFALSPGTALLSPNTHFVVGIGRKSLLGMQTGMLLPDLSLRSKTTPDTQVAFASHPAQNLPSTYQAYSCVDSIIWHDPDPKALEADQRKALAGFVQRGGHLVLVAEADTRLTEIPDFPELPGAFQGPCEVTLNTDDSSRRWPDGWNGLFRADGKPIDAIQQKQATKLMLNQLSPAKHGHILARHDDDKALCIRSYSGAGRITMLAVDPQNHYFTDVRRVMLSRILDLPLHLDQLKAMGDCRGMIHLAESGALNYNYRVLTPSAITDTFVSGADELQPVPFGAIVLFLFFFFLLTGPVNYLYLRRSKRLPYTYLLFGVTSIAFTALAYGGAYMIKGNRNFIRDVTLLDVDSNGVEIRQTFFGVYASRPRSIKLRIDGEPYINGLGTVDIGRRRYYNQFGQISDQVTCIPGARRIALENHSATPESLRLRQWKIERYFLQSSASSSSPLIVEDLTIDRESDASKAQAHSAITNSSQHKLRRVTLVTNRNVFTLAVRIAPGETRNVSALSHPLAHTLSEITQTSNSWQRRDRTGKPLLANDIFALSFSRLQEAYMVGTIIPGNSNSPYNNSYTHKTPAGDGAIADILDLIHEDKQNSMSDLARLRTLVSRQSLPGIDLTHVLCEGGAVIFAASDEPTGDLSLANTETERASQTIIRLILPPERIRHERND